MSVDKTVNVEQVNSQTDSINSLTKSIDKLFGSVNKLSKSYESQSSILNNYSSSFQQSANAMSNFNDMSDLSINSISSLDDATKDLSDTIGSQLTSSLEDASKKLKSTRESFQKFEENMKKSSDVLSIFTQPLSKITALIPGLNKAFKSIGGFTKSSYSLYKSVSLTTDTFGKFALVSKGIGAVLGGVVGAGLGVVSFAFNAVTKAAGFALSAVSGFASFAMNVFKGIKDVAFGFVKTIMTIPLQIAKVSAEVGNKLRKIIVEQIGNASEDSKKLFDHSSELGKTIASVSLQTIGLIGAFTQTNSEATRLFGTFENYQKKQYEAVDSLGQFADLYGAQLARGTKEAYYFEQAQQALSLTATDNLYLVTEAAKNGEAVYSTIERRRFALESVSKEFDLDRKRLSTNFNKLRVDITNFGHLSDNELYKVTARATELGLEVKGLTSIFSKFDTFEGAATSAAQLSQMFGMNVDALDLIRAKDPMEIVDMFREAMFQTGRSFDDMNRHEKSLLASQTGMSAEQLKIAMNFRTMGKSAEETRAAMAAATPEGKQIKAIKEMSGVIKSFKKTLEFNNLFDSIKHGFDNMIIRNAKLRKAFMGMSLGYEGIANFITGLSKNKDVTGALEALAGVVRQITTILTGPDMKKAITTGIKFISNAIQYIMFEYNRLANNTDINEFGTKLEGNIRSLFGPKSVLYKIADSLWKVGKKIAKGIIFGFLLVFPDIASSLFDTFRNAITSISRMLKGDESTKGFKKWVMSLFGSSEKEANKIAGEWSNLFTKIKDEWNKDGGIFDLDTGPFATMFDYLTNKLKSVGLPIGAAIGDAITKSIASNFPKLASFFGMSDDDIEKYNRKQGKTLLTDARSKVGKKGGVKGLEEATGKLEKKVFHHDVFDDDWTSSATKSMVKGALDNSALQQSNQLLLAAKEAEMAAKYKDVNSADIVSKLKKEQTEEWFGNIEEDNISGYIEKAAANQGEMTTDQLHRFRKDMKQLLLLRFKESMYSEGSRGYEKNRDFAEHFLGAINDYKPKDKTGSIFNYNKSQGEINESAASLQSLKMGESNAKYSQNYKSNIKARDQIDSIRNQLIEKALSDGKVTTQELQAIRELITAFKNGTQKSVELTLNDEVIATSFINLLGDPNMNANLQNTIQSLSANNGVALQPANGNSRTNRQAANDK